MRKLTLALLIATALTTGCASKPQENPYAGYDKAVVVPVRLHHEFYSSWGHDGRGGAALRKPTYQHVMGSEDMVMTTRGNYADLRANNGKTVSTINTAMTMGMGSAITNALNTAPPISGSTTDSGYKRPPLTATNLEYESAYRKFCNGASMTMSERDWEIVALGGPKGIPPQMRGKCMHSK